MPTSRGTRRAFVRFRVPVSWRVLIERTVRDTMEDNCLGLAAQLSFYFLLALFPALIFLVALVGYLPVDNVVDDLLRSLEGVAPSQVLGIVRRQLEQILEGSRAGLLTAGILGALWSSSAAMMAIITTLNQAFDQVDRRPWWKTRALAIGMTIMLAVLVVVAQTLLLLGPWLAGLLAEWTGLPLEPLWIAARWPIVFLLIVLALDLVYYLAPDVDQRWEWITPGALLATTLWLVASIGFRLYVTHFGSYNAVYGTLGGVVVIMMWFYLSGLAILVGAELNSEINHAIQGRLRGGAAAPAEPAT